MEIKNRNELEEAATKLFQKIDGALYSTPTDIYAYISRDGGVELRDEYNAPDSYLDLDNPSRKVWVYTWEPVSYYQAWDWVCEGEDLKEILEQLELSEAEAQKITGVNPDKYEAREDYEYDLLRGIGEQCSTEVEKAYAKVCDKYFSDAYYKEIRDIIRDLEYVDLEELFKDDD